MEKVQKVNTLFSMKFRKVNVKCGQMKKERASKREWKNMTAEEFYGDKLEVLETARTDMLKLLGHFPDDKKSGFHAVQYTCSRIKSPDSMIEKLKRKSLPETLESALSTVHDAVGIRVICSFADDVFKVEKWLKSQENYELIKEKDYISYPKPNGYRGIHLIMRVRSGETAGTYVEIQLRTIAMDFWASLEHQLKYKKEIGHAAMMGGELKQCADEIASVDLSMQTIRDIIQAGD